MSDAKAALVLEDGSIFEGIPFGAAGGAFGETVFYTGVVGYQEVLTHPSYRQTLVVMTYPIIGSYGTNGEDNESPGVQAAGLIVREYSPYFSNFRATASLEAFMVRHGVVGIREVDTRAVAVHLRDCGEMRGAIVRSEKVSGTLSRRVPDTFSDLARKLKGTPSPFGQDLAAKTTWEGVRKADGRQRHKVVALNLGITSSLLAQLSRLGCTVDVVSCGAGAKDILARKPQGVIVAGGPGDPRAAAGAVETVRSLVGKTPLLGIGLGHQVLALALGCGIRRLKVGHHGVNYPVRDLVDGTSHITVQHHSFVVDESAIPKGIEVTHQNQNDGTVEGLRRRKGAAGSVQFHPCPDEMGRPSPLLARWCKGLPAH
jgi:carbamoyl-phosphate synthase small subunit